MKRERKTIGWEAKLAVFLDPFINFLPQPAAQAVGFEVVSDVLVRAGVKSDFVAVILQLMQPVDLAGNGFVNLGHTKRGAGAELLKDRSCAHPFPDKQDVVGKANVALAHTRTSCSVCAPTSNTRL